MTQLFVPDSSALVAALLDSGADGTWARQTLAASSLTAPSHLPFEVSNVLRRAERMVDPGQTAQAHADLISLEIELWPYELLAGRCWELRRNLTIYDAAYVAAAEATGASLVTLDRRLAHAPGPRCAILTPPNDTAARDA